MKTYKIHELDTRILDALHDETEVQEGWIVVESFPDELLNNPREWMYINGTFIHETEEYVRRQLEEGILLAQRNSPIILQTQYITREDFNLLDAQDDNTLYYIQEEDGSTTMVKGENL